LEERKDYINVLAVLISPRDDARKTRKKDYYLVDASSIYTSSTDASGAAQQPSSTSPRRRKKTIISVWRDQQEFHQAITNPTNTPPKQQIKSEKDVRGTIVAIYGAGVNKNYEEDVKYKVLRRVDAKVEYGHLNIYASNPMGWFVIDPVGVPGYDELVRWRDEVLVGEWDNELAELAKEREEGLKMVMRKEEKRARAIQELKRKDEDLEREDMDKQQGQHPANSKTEKAKGKEKTTNSEQEETDKELEQLEYLKSKGMVWYLDGKPFWRIDGLY
jgi:hypothetical protein